MAHSLSAKKRIRQSAKRRLRNRSRKAALRIETKKFDAMIAKGDAGAAEEFKKAQQTIDRIAGRGTIHRNTAARRKARLARKLNAMKAGGATPAKA